MLILLKYRINILYPPWHSGIADSHFVVSLLIRNNKMGHRINKMDIHFNKVGHRNSKVGHRNNKVGVYETTKWGSVPVSTSSFSPSSSLMDVENEKEDFH